MYTRQYPAADERVPHYRSMHWGELAIVHDPPDWRVEALAGAGSQLESVDAIGSVDTSIIPKSGKFTAYTPPLLVIYWTDVVY